MSKMIDIDIPGDDLIKSIRRVVISERDELELYLEGNGIGVVVPYDEYIRITQDLDYYEEAYG
jgi:hypothetical protein